MSTEPQKDRLDTPEHRWLLDYVRAHPNVREDEIEQAIEAAFDAEALTEWSGMMADQLFDLVRKGLLDWHGPHNLTTPLRYTACAPNAPSAP